MAHPQTKTSRGKEQYVSIMKEPFRLPDKLSGRPSFSLSLLSLMSDIAFRTAGHLIFLTFIPS